MIWLCMFAHAGEVDMTPDATTSEEEIPTGPDRSIRPEVGKPSPLDLEDMETHPIAPGLTGHHIRVPRVRQVKVILKHWRGMVELEGKSSELSTIVDNAWTWGSEKYPPDQLSELSDLLDLSISSSVGAHSVSLELEVPAEDLDQGLDILADVYLHPTFPKKELKLTKENYDRYYTSQGPKSPSSVASATMRFAWTDAAHPYGVRHDPELIQKVKTKQLIALHQRLLSQGPVSITVIGDLAWSDIEPKLKARFGSIGVEGDRAERLDRKQPNAFRVLAIDMPESEQAVMRLRLSAPTRDSDERVPMDAVGFALGGHFLARLNKNLREDKGWTYGTRAWYAASDQDGEFNIGVDVPVDKFAAAAVEVQKELAAIASDGVTEDEIAAFWRSEVMSFNSTRGTVGDAAGLYRSLQYHEENVTDRVGWLEAISSVDPGTTQVVAAKVFADDAPRLWVVAGPKSELTKGLEELGWEAEWITAEDAIVGSLKGGQL